MEELDGERAQKSRANEECLGRGDLEALAKGLGGGVVVARLRKQEEAVVLAVGIWERNLGSY